METNENRSKLTKMNENTEWKWKRIERNEIGMCTIPVTMFHCVECLFFSCFIDNI